MLTALKELFRGILAPTLYVTVFITFLVSARKRAEWAVYLLAILAPLPEKEWTVEGLKKVVQGNLGDCKLGQLLWPLRAAMTGLPYSPGAFEVAEALGKKTVMKRIAAAMHAS